MTRDSVSSHINIFTDGSKHNDPAGVGAAIYSPTLPLSQKYTLPPLTSIFTAEIFAIRQALLYVKSHQLKKVLICTDSLSTLQALKGKYDIHWYIHHIRQLCYELQQQNVDVIFTWVPGHTGIPGNHCVDKLANEAASGSGFPLNIALPYTDVLSEVNHTLMEESNNHWILSARSKGSHYFLQQPNIPRVPWFKHSTYSRRHISAITRLRFNHLRIPTCLFRIGVRQDDLCSACNLHIGDINHLVFQCRSFDEERKIFMSRLATIGFTFPLNVATLVVHPNSPAVQILINFLDAVGIQP